jgi:hypothetical protein
LYRPSRKGKGFRKLGDGHNGTISLSYPRMNAASSADGSAVAT